MVAIVYIFTTVTSDRQRQSKKYHIKLMVGYWKVTQSSLHNV